MFVPPHFQTQNLGLGIEPTDICDVTLAWLASRYWARQMCPPPPTFCHVPMPLESSQGYCIDLVVGLLMLKGQSVTLVTLLMDQWMPESMMTLLLITCQLQVPLPKSDLLVRYQLAPRSGPRSGGKWEWRFCFV